MSVRADSMNDHPLLTFEQAGQALVHYLPELEEAYRQEVEWWGEEKPPAYPLYDEILNPYINSLLERPDVDADVALKRVFGFIEHLATAQDPRLRELVGVGICEAIVEDRTRLSRARRYMGRATLKICRVVERR